MSTTRAQPSWKAATVSMPLVGSQSSFREKTTINIRPSQKSGVAYDTRARIEISVSRQLPARAAARRPSTMPVATEATSVVTMSRSVGPSRPRISSSTGMLWRNEKPRSSTSMLLT